MAAKIWDERFILKGYTLAREGANDVQIAQALGVAASTIIFWRDKYPAFDEALNQARGLVKRGAAVDRVETFSEYVYKKLPQELQELWDELSAWEREPNAQKGMERLLRRAGEPARQYLFLHALMTTGFSVSTACSKVNVTSKRFRMWLETDPNFAELVSEVQWHRKNFCEESLMHLVAIGEPSVVTFVNKTLNRDRGYNEKVEIDLTQHSTAQAPARPLDQLNLPVETLAQLLEATRQAAVTEYKAEALTVEHLPYAANH